MFRPSLTNVRYQFVLALCALVVVAEGYDLIVYGTLIPSLLSEPGWALTRGEAGSIGSLVYVGMLVGALLSGRLSDRYGRRRLVLTCVAWFLVWTAACALAVAPWQLGLFRLLAGIGMGGVMPSVLALVKEYTPARRTSLAITVLMAGVPFGGSAAAVLGLAVLPGHGWRAMFWVGAGISVLILVVAWGLLPESMKFQASTARPPMRALFGRQMFAATVLFALAAFTNLLTWYGLNTWLTTVMRDLDYPLSSALQFSLTLNVGAIVGSFVFALGGDRFGPRPGALVASVVTAAAIAGTAAGPGAAIVLLALIAVMGAGAQSALNLINAAVAAFYPTAIRATALGWSNGIGRLGAIASPWLGGIVLSSGAGPTTLFWTFAGSATTSAIVLALLVFVAPASVDADVSPRLATPEILH
jgi:AAHS family benzoate transporter-like MFS transporter